LSDIKILDVGEILKSIEGLWLYNSCLLKYQVLVLEGAENTLWIFQNLIWTFSLPKGERKPEHSGKEVLIESYAARSDLTDHILDNPDLVLYTDGNSFSRDGIRYVSTI
jgi:hypothetical protein